MQIDAGRAVTTEQMILRRRCADENTSSVTFETYHYPRHTYGNSVAGGVRTHEDYQHHNQQRPNTPILGLEPNGEDRHPGLLCDTRHVTIMPRVPSSIAARGSACVMVCKHSVPCTAGTECFCNDAVLPRSKRTFNTNSIECWIAVRQ